LANLQAAALTLALLPSAALALSRAAQLAAEVTLGAYRSLSDVPEVLITGIYQLACDVFYKT
jgi:hypothetical protein